MHFKDIEIVNFRGFDKLEIKDFKQINLFVGKNNSGKTSILEVLSIILNSISNPQILLSNNEWVRDIKTSDMSDLLNLFYNQDTKNEIGLKSEFDSYSKEVKIKVGPDYNLNNPVLPIPNLINNSYIELLTETYDKIAEERNQFNSKIKFEINKRGSFTVENDLYTERNSPKNQILTGKLTYYFLSSWISILRENKQIKRLVDILVKIAPNLEDIEVIDSKVLVNISGMEKLLPINVMGDGIRKIASLLGAALWCENGVLLIDEIENGFHYSSHRILWRSLIEVCRKENVQVFITTHSLESLKYFKEVMEESDHIDFQDNVRCFDVEKTKQAGYKVYKYSFEGFSEALNNENEIR